MVQEKLASLRHVWCDRVGALFAGAIVSIAAGTAHLSPAYAAPDCFDGHNVKVVISGQLFSIPIRYRPLISVSGGKVIVPVYRGPHARCSEKFFKSNSEPVDTESVGLRGLSDVSDPRFPVLHRVSLQLWSTEPFSFDHREIKQFKDKIERSGTLVENLPQFAGFYASAQTEGTQFFKSPFMAAPGGITTPSGNPIVFQCYGAVIAPQKSIPPSGPKPMCTVSYNLSRTIGVHYGFSEADFRIDNWAVLDAAIRAFIERLIVEPAK